MLTPEREAEIRGEYRNGDWLSGYSDVPDLLAEIDRLRAELQDAEHALADERSLHELQKNVAARLRAENERLHIRDKMREDGKRLLLSEVEARDAEIKALREAAWYAVDADDAKDGRFALRKALAGIWGDDPS